MTACPWCGYEGPAGLFRCPACGRQFRQRWQALPTTGEAAARGLAVLWEGADLAEVDLVVALLQAHGIRCLVRADRSLPEGGPWQAGPLASHRVFVRGDQLEEARAVLDAQVDEADWSRCTADTERGDRPAESPVRVSAQAEGR